MAFWIKSSQFLPNDDIRIAVSRSSLQATDAICNSCWRALKQIAEENPGDSHRPSEHRMRRNGELREKRNQGTQSQKE